MIFDFQEQNHPYKMAEQKKSSCCISLFSVSFDTKKNYFETQ